jgi:hypothetical protein
LISWHRPHFAGVSTVEASHSSKLHTFNGVRFIILGNTDTISCMLNTGFLIAAFFVDSPCVKNYKIDIGFCELLLLVTLIGLPGG